jgi:hypothetical protein
MARLDRHGDLRARQRDLASAEHLAFTHEIIERIPDHDHDIDGFAPLQPIRYRGRCVTYRRTSGGNQFVAGLLFEPRRQSPIGSRKSSGTDDMDLVGRRRQRDKRQNRRCQPMEHTETAKPVGHGLSAVGCLSCTDASGRSRIE